MGFENLRRVASLSARFTRNALIDFRFGHRYLGGVVPTPYAALGAYDTTNTDYGALPHLFEGRIRSDDVLVDVGCGKGRVINWWLSRGLTNRIVGIELNAAVGLQTTVRLRPYKNVIVLIGDAVSLLPRNGTVLYLFNPFSGAVIRRFRERIATNPVPPRLIVYYNPVHLAEFAGDRRFEVDHVTLPAGFHSAAIIRPRRAVATDREVQWWGSQTGVLADA